MAKTTIEIITEVEEQIRQFENRRKELIQQQKEEARKERTHRICKRGGLLESMLPDTIPLTDEQFNIFLEKTIKTPFALKMLDAVKTQVIEASGKKPEDTQGKAG